MKHARLAMSMTVCLAIVLVVSSSLGVSAGPSRVLALIHGMLIDGTGAAPVPDAVVIIEDGLVARAGGSAEIAVPDGAEVVDVSRDAILPGFINAHVHDGFQPPHLQDWLRAGVTSVVDMGLRGGQETGEMAAARNGRLNQPEYARVFMAGPMLTVPGGYGLLAVASAADARAKVSEIIDAGADLIKLSQEDGYAGAHGLPKLTVEEMSAIISEAHARGKRAAVHITQAVYMEKAVQAGADIIAHVPYDRAGPDMLAAAARGGVYLTPTFSVFRNYGAPVSVCIDNLRQFALAGGHVALGSDFDGGPGEFERGIPMYELECMRAAGMTAMEIVVAATRNSAWVAGHEDTLGTLTSGKLADVLVVRGDPLLDMQCLQDVRMVIKGGEIAFER